MEKTEVQTKVKKVVSKVLKMDPSEIRDDANFVFDLGADSMQSIEMMAGFEEEFNIEMDQNKALEVQTIDGAVDFISSQLINA
ncbi:MAG TPA: phosphopantetheine-binding protein [Cyclobacteriaceae bacterium]|nr:phosphopantetheine-binding protein [Cyclobacteriaceae bacterium]